MANARAEELRATPQANGQRGQIDRALRSAAMVSGGKVVGRCVFECAVGWLIDKHLYDVRS